MNKDFTHWHTEKTSIENDRQRPFFHEREVWWCAIGLNVGYEQDGKGATFSRPVLVLKKFNNEIFWGVPCTTKIKDSKFYAPIELGDEIKRAVILSQIRLIDGKRLQEKQGVITEENLDAVKKAITRLLG